MFLRIDPNPINLTTRIEFHIARAGLVEIEVFDAMGKRVAELVNKHLPSGVHTIYFDATGLSSGIYIVSMTASGTTEIKKIKLL